MGFFAQILPLVLAALTVVNGAAIKSLPAGAEAVPNGYIIMMKDSLSTKDFDSHRKWISNLHQERLARRGSTKVGGVKHTYKFATGLKGYAGTFDEETIQEIAKRSDVEFIERDTIVNKFALQTQPNAPSWGLGRTSSKQRGDRSYYYDSTAGEGVTAYIVDTGIDIRHTDFGGRATWGTNTADNQDTDCHGHGTHCAGTVAGSSFGLAKKAKLIAVKVLNCQGSGTNSGVIQGMEWTVNHARQSGNAAKSVVNMSLGGGYSAATNRAAAAITQAGLFLAVAAGNDNQDARNSSPASEPSACTVAASTNGDSKASFSNWGSIIDVYAPGQDIISARAGGGSTSMSGTSMASPHVCGLGAYLVGLEGIGASQACNRIKALAHAAIGNPGSGTTNKLIYNNSGK